MAMATETQTSRIVTKVQPSVARISLRNPPLNVIDFAVMDELVQVISDIEGRPDISAILISGNGGSSSAGVDVAAHTLDKAQAMLSKCYAGMGARVSTKKVTVGAV